MKKHLILFMAAGLVGLLFFLIWYFVFDKDVDTALELGILAGASGLLLEYVKPLWVRKTK